MDCGRLSFLLLAVNDSRESISRYFEYEIVYENLKKFEIAVWRIYWDQVKSFNEKNTESKVVISVFFYKWLLLTSMDMSRKDSYFFLEYSWSYSQSTPQSFHHRGVESPRCIYDRGVVIPRSLHHWDVNIPQCRSL